MNGSTIRGTAILRQIEIAALAGYGGIELWFDDVDAHLVTSRGRGARSPVHRRGRAVVKDILA